MSIRARLRDVYFKRVPSVVQNAISFAFLLRERFVPPRVVAVPDAARVLVLAPHPDDEAIGCGGAILHHVRRGAQVTVCFVTDGSRGDARLRENAARGMDTARLRDQLKHLRQAEAREAAGVLGVRDLRFLDFPDGELTKSRETELAIAGVLGECKPGVVYLPFLTDRHRDHFETNSIFLAAARGSGLPLGRLFCFGYEVWSPLYANRLIDITAVMPLKREAISRYRSQIASTDYLKCIEGLNAYRAMAGLKGRGYAEAFFGASFSNYEYLHRRLTGARA